MYISSDIQTGKNKIIVADPDGKNAHPVPMSGAVVPDIIDAPIFSPDGQTILFSAPIPVKAAAPTWLERLLGITRGRCAQRSFRMVERACGRRAGYPIDQSAVCRLVRQ